MPSKKPVYNSVILPLINDHMKNQEKWLNQKKPKAKIKVKIQIAIPMIIASIINATSRRTQCSCNCLSFWITSKGVVKL